MALNDQQIPSRLNTRELIDWLNGLTIVSGSGGGATGATGPRGVTGATGPAGSGGGSSYFPSGW